MRDEFGDFDSVNEILLPGLTSPGLNTGDCWPRVEGCIDFDSVETLQIVIKPSGLRHARIKRVSPLPVAPAGATDVNGLPMLRRALWTFSFLLEAIGMHLCSALDIVLALLFASHTSAFPAFLWRQFDPRQELHLTLYPFFHNKAWAGCPADARILVQRAGAGEARLAGAAEVMATMFCRPLEPKHLPLACFGNILLHIAAKVDSRLAERTEAQFFICVSLSSTSTMPKRHGSGCDCLQSP
ncbi:hypothetical protein ABIF26_005442 [Bradyrhizobium elkanii]